MQGAISPDFPQQISIKEVKKNDTALPLQMKVNQTHQTSNFESSFLDSSHRDSSFCTNSSLEGADYDEEIIPQAKKKSPNCDKTLQNN